MSTLILFTVPPVSQSDFLMTKNDTMRMQTTVYETLTIALRRLPLSQRQNFIVRVLTIALDLPNLASLPADALVGLLFETLDRTTNPRTLLSIQNIMTYVCQLLLGVHAS